MQQWLTWGRQWLLLMVQGPPENTSRAVLASDDRLDPAFKPIYEREILPHLVDFEEKRCAALHSLWLRSFIGIPVIVFGVIVLGYVFTRLPGDKDGFFELCFLGISAICVWMYRKIKLYHGDVKGQVFPIVFRHFGDFFYTAHADFPYERWQDTTILPDVSSSHFEDKVKGTYREVPLTIVEAKLIKGTGKHKSTVFKGLMAQMGVGKRFSGTTLIRRDKGTLGNLIRSSRFERVRLENPLFEERYEVFGTDQVEARYLISTSFMERMMELEDQLDSKIEAAFHNSELLLTISSKRNWFEPGSIYEPATFVDDIGLIFDQMKSLFQIIDILQLDDRTGL